MKQKVLLLVGLLLFALLPMYAGARPQSLQYTPHDPIELIGDTDPDWASFPGSGTPSDPYIIEGYSISTQTADGIYIRDTTVYFVIRDCYIYGPGNTGIHLRNVTNGVVENCIINYTYCGLYMYNVSNIDAAALDILFCHYGIYIYDVASVQVTDSCIDGCMLGFCLGSYVADLYIGNNVVLRCYYGIMFPWVLTGCSNVVLRNNVFYNCGYAFHYYPYSTYISQFFTVFDIDSSNYVNGAPVQIVINTAGTSLSGDIGLLAIINSTNISVQDARIEPSCPSVCIYGSERVTLYNVSVPVALCGYNSDEVSIIASTLDTSYWFTELLNVNNTLLYFCDITTYDLHIGGCNCSIIANSIVASDDVDLGCWGEVTLAHNYIEASYEIEVYHSSALESNTTVLYNNTIITNDLDIRYCQELHIVNSDITCYQCRLWHIDYLYLIDSEVCCGDYFETEYTDEVGIYNSSIVCLYGLYLDYSTYTWIGESELVTYNDYVEIYDSTITEIWNSFLYSTYEVDVYYSDEIYIVGSTLKSVDYIYIGDSNYTLLYDSRFTEALYIDISYISELVVYGCWFEHSDETDFYSIDNATVVHSVFYNNIIACSVYYSNITLYDNAFLNNVLDLWIYYYGNSNVTCYTTPYSGTNIAGGPNIGGNYWDRYTGSDSDNDGFGDVPYEVFVGVVDEYPLVDNWGPFINLIIPLDGVTLTNGTVLFIAEVVDGVSVTAVELYVDGGYMGSMWFNGTHYLYIANLGDGVHTWYITAYDQAGNPSTSSQRTLTIDTIPPAVSLVSPVYGETTNTTLEIVVSATDATTGIASVTVYIDGTPYSLTFNGTHYTTTVTVAEGPHLICAEAADGVGLATRTPDSVFYAAVYTDTVAPTVTLVAPADHYNTSATTVQFVVEVSDNVAIDTVTLYVGGTSYVMSFNGTHYVYEATLAEGTYAWYVTANDTSGNAVTSGSRLLIIYTPTPPPDTTPPTIQLVTPENRFETGESSVTFVASVTDDTDIASVTLWVDDTSYTMSFNGTHYLATASLTDGWHTWWVVATDAAGNTAQSPARLVRTGYIAAPPAAAAVPLWSWLLIVALAAGNAVLAAALLLRRKKAEEA